MIEIHCFSEVLDGKMKWCLYQIDCADYYNLAKIALKLFNDTVCFFEGRTNYRIVEKINKFLSAQPLSPF